MAAQREKGTEAGVKVHVFGRQEAWGGANILGEYRTLNWVRICHV
jgi:hypothetical protein